MEWTGKRGVIHSNCRTHHSSGDCAAVYNYPGENCCTCGKEGAALPSTPIPKKSDPAPRGTCVDTPGWTNKGLHKHKGYTCDDYKNKRWCANGGFPKGMEWTGKRGTIHRLCRKHD